MAIAKTGVCCTIDSNLISMNKDEYRKKFANKFRALMDERDISYNSLAKATGISYYAICSYGIGKIIPTLYNLQLMAEALGCSLDDFKA